MKSGRDRPGDLVTWAALKKMDTNIIEMYMFQLFAQMSDSIAAGQGGRARRNLTTELSAFPRTTFTVQHFYLLFSPL